MKVNVVKCFDCWSHTQHTSSPKDGDMVQREIYVCVSDSMNVAYRYISCLRCVCSFFFIFLSDFSFTRWYSVPALSTWARHPKNVNKFSTPLLRTLVLFLLCGITYSIHSAILRLSTENRFGFRNIVCARSVSLYLCSSLSLASSISVVFIYSLRHSFIRLVCIDGEEVL